MKTLNMPDDVYEALVTFLKGNKQWICVQNGTRLKLVYDFLTETGDIIYEEGED